MKRSNLFSIPSWCDVRILLEIAIPASLVIGLFVSIIPVSIYQSFIEEWYRIMLA